jgi:hypothetical protein
MILDHPHSLSSSTSKQNIPSYSSIFSPLYSILLHTSSFKSLLHPNNKRVGPTFISTPPPPLPLPFILFPRAAPPLSRLTRGAEAPPPSPALSSLLSHSRLLGEAAPCLPCSLPLSTASRDLELSSPSDLVARALRCLSFYFPCSCALRNRGRAGRRGGRCQSSFAGASHSSPSAWHGSKVGGAGQPRGEQGRAPRAAVPASKRRSEAADQVVLQLR